MMSCMFIGWRYLGPVDKRGRYGIPYPVPPTRTHPAPPGGGPTHTATLHNYHCVSTS